ncbi:kinetochore protein SPC25 homolog isoform X2 [Papaver somniferum]|uniref:kinetochore protein SPC25 homolog isoform X2 n=1 Tax=Papaver somniferum TaxID=3469 RepID=UPI000E6FAE51|nr:kinetochore protein SPC25 homolog isoform X2 [Papaver somniferum]
MGETIQKMQKLRLECETEIPIQLQQATSALTSFRNSLDFIELKSAQTSQNQEKLGYLKTGSRELEDELVKALAVKTDREAKRLDLNDSVLAAKARIEELKRIVQIKTAKEEEYGAIISRQSMEAQEEKVKKITDHKESTEDAISWYNKVLGFRIEGGRGVKFIFNNINTEHPHEEYSFIVRHEDNTYTLLDCHPFVEDTKELVQELNRTNGLFKFVRIMREKFQAAVSIGYPDQATSVHPESAMVSVSAPTSLDYANGSESRNEQNQLPDQPGAPEICNKKVKRVGVEKSQILSPASASASSHRRSPRLLAKNRAKNN